MSIGRRKKRANLGERLVNIVGTTKTRSRISRSSREVLITGEFRLYAHRMQMK